MNMQTGEIVGFIMLLALFVGPLEFLRRKFKSKMLRGIVLTLQIGFTILLLASTIDGSAKKSDYLRDNRGQIISDIKALAGEGKIEDAENISRKWDGRGDQEIDDLHKAVLLKKADLKREADAKRLIELDNLIKKSGDDSTMLGYYKERYNLTGSKEDSAQISKYEGKAKERREALKRDEEAVKAALSMPIYLLEVSIKDGLLVPGSYKYIKSRSHYTKDGKYIMAAVEYTSKNAFGVDIRTMTGALFSKDGKTPIRGLSNKEVQGMF